MQHLFVYGTLLLPEIRQKLTGKVFEIKPVSLVEFKRCGIKGCDYPVIVPNISSTVEGLLLKNVDDHSIEILTFFEGDEYQLEKVEVTTEKEKIEAVTYLWKGNLEFLLDVDWDLQQFKKESLKIYLDEIVPETILAFQNS